MDGSKMLTNCPDCNGSGKIESELDDIGEICTDEDCFTCNGTGQIEQEE